MAPRRSSHRAIDDLVIAMAQSHSRRTTLRILAGAVAGGAGSLVTPGRTRAQTDPVITGFVLVDAETDTDMAVLTDGVILGFGDGLNVRAVTDPDDVGPVSFDLDGVGVIVEQNPPYALFGNSGSNYNAGDFSPGLHTLTATIVDGGASLTVTFSVAADEATATPEPTATDEPTATTEPTATNTHTPAPTATNTPAPPTATNTPLPPTATVAATGTPDVFQGVVRCSTAKHDSYVTTAPNGISYKTWHPLIDSENGQPCSHRHEHGSNPANLHADWHPAFEYVASQHGMTEGHVGFKVAVVPGPDDQPVGVMFHMGSASLARACIQFHTLEFVFLANDGSLGAHLQFMGDFGKAIHNDSQVGLTPPSCPNQTVTGGSTGVRQLPGPSGNQGYEPWRPDLKKTVFGFVADFTFNNRTAIVVCNRIPECDAPLAFTPGRTGSNRFLSGNNSPQGVYFRLDASKAKAGATGNFCTDPLGRVVVACGSAGAIPQYTAPGLLAVWPCGGHAAGGQNGAILACNVDSAEINQTGGIKPGGPN